MLVERFWPIVYTKNGLELSLKVYSMHNISSTNSAIYILLKIGVFAFQELHKSRKLSKKLSEPFSKQYCTTNAQL